MKKVMSFIIVVIAFCSPAAAYDVTAFDGEAAETLTIAQASKNVYCPACGAKNPTGAAYCSSCGKTMPNEAVAHCPGCGAKLEPGAAYCASCGSTASRRARGEWDRNVMAISGNVGGIFGDNSFGGPGVDVAFQVSDYFALGPEFSYLFGGDSEYLLAGLEFRPYFVPYSRSIFVKPHAYFGGGYARVSAGDWRYTVTFDGGYARVGGGIDFRAGSFVVPYFGAGFFISFMEGDNYKKGQAEGGVRFAF